jgi:MFS family permease
MSEQIAYRVPALIKRNTALFALAQSFTGAGMQFAYALGPLMVLALTGSAALTGLSVGLIGVSRFLIAYPAGKITDAYGRKPGILLGLVLAFAGALTVGLSMHFGSFAVLFAGMLVFGMGMSAAQQLRVAAADMYLPSRRAEALGYVALGSLVGLLIAPLLIAGAEWLAPRVGYDALGLPWLLLPALIVAGMALVFFVRPDPREIGMHLERYYPGYQPPRREPGEHAPFSVRGLLKNPPIRLAIVCNTGAQGNMSMVMVLTSLVLHHRGHSLAAIAFSHMFHAAGMFAFTIPLGMLADRLGRSAVMIPGVATALAGAGLVAFAESYWMITLGTFLVGLGWAGANVAATAMIADHAPTPLRGRAIGLNETFAGAIAVAMALATGALIEWHGFPATGLVAMLVALPPLAMAAVSRMKPRAERRAA